MINLYDQQRRNVRRTWMVLFGFVLFLVFLGLGADAFLYGSGVGPGIPVATLGALCLGGFSAWWAFAGGDKAVLESTHAVPIDPSDPRQRMLDNVVEEMAIAAGVPKPAVYVIPDSDPNAFATGTGPEKSSVAVTAGLLQTLTREELQGVVAHELSHVRNYDIRVMTVVAALVGSVLLLSDWGRRGLWWGGGRRRSSEDGGGGSGPLAILFFVVWVVSLLLAPLIAQLVAMAVSREREYLADASGAELTRNPLSLASALEKIDAAVAPTPSIKQGVAHLCIADPRGRALNDREGGWANLFSTHPPIAKRIELLRQMAYQTIGAGTPRSS
jgi:heat shock protein HtpX